MPASDCRAARPEGEAVLLQRKKICDFCHLQILAREQWQTSGLLVYHVSCWDAFLARERKVFKEPKR